ncbi:hypothetical protein ACQ5SK_03350 [Bradyrhizobium japonicum]
MILGFLWIDVFSEYSYPQLLAGLSAGLSLILVLLPMLFVRAPFRQLVALSNARFEHLLTLILAISIGTIAVASTYNFRLVAIANIYDYRGEIAFPSRCDISSAGSPARCCRSPSPVTGYSAIAGVPCWS